MTKKWYYTFFLFVLISCNTQSFTNMPHELSSNDSLKLALLGQWGGLGESNPAWKIKPDSIYNFQDKTTYPYKIIQNDLVIERPRKKSIFINISVSADTMTFYNEQGSRVTGYRLKDKNFRDGVWR